MNRQQTHWLAERPEHPASSHPPKDLMVSRPYPWTGIALWACIFAAVMGVVL